MSKIFQASFDSQFIESYAGSTILSDPKVAIIELIANAWDAGATKVVIQLPIEHGDSFSVADNGHGMTKSQFQARFMTFGYRRNNEQGPNVEFPNQNGNSPKRSAFGKNAKGKLAAFQFGPKFFVRTERDGLGHLFQVERSSKAGLLSREEESFISDNHGTEVFVPKAKAPNLGPDEARAEIGMRFLSDPKFEVFVNNVPVTFADIPEEHIRTAELDIPGIGTAKITILDNKESDKSTHQHGIAWWVNGRLVGECTWKGTGHDHLFDGRRVPAKRYTFIVQADFLNSPGIVLPDWSGFNPKEPDYQKVNEAVTRYVHDYILELSKETREEVLTEIKRNNKGQLRKMTLSSREKWEDFVSEVQRECPSITDDDLSRVSRILAKLENAESKYGLIQQLSEMDSNNLDDLNRLLQKWDVDLAKIVLDELQGRLQLIERLQQRINNKLTDELHDLQPLFQAGLWIFGPEFESIEYISNRTLTSVIQQLFGSSDSAGLNRPDFVVLPDSTVGLYSFPRFDDDDGEEIGPDKITVVELKKPGVPIGKAEKDQARDYAYELRDRGHIKTFSKVTCFVLGETIVPNYEDTMSDWEGRLKVKPLTYETVLGRAKSRSLKLYDRVRNAPFLQDTRIEEFLAERTDDLFASSIH
jgi:BMFP domain-containing protein YqiC